MATLVKICGITKFEDARAALELGADWIGLNLVAGPRKLDVDVAVEIASQLPDVSCAVALVPVTNTPAFGELIGKLASAGVKRLQLYGDAMPTTIADLRGAGFGTIAVLRVKATRDLIAQAHHSGGHDLQAIGFKAGVNLANDVLANSVRFDDGQGAFYGHGALQKVNPECVCRPGRCPSRTSPGPARSKPRNYTDFRSLFHPE